MAKYALSVLIALFAGVAAMKFMSPSDSDPARPPANFSAALMGPTISVDPIALERQAQRDLPTESWDAK